MEGNHNTLHINDLALAYFRACADYGDKQPEVIIKVCEHYLQFTDNKGYKARVNKILKSIMEGRKLGK